MQFPSPSPRRVWLGSCKDAPPSVVGVPRPFGYRCKPDSPSGGGSAGPHLYVVDLFSGALVVGGLCPNVALRVMEASAGKYFQFHLTHHNHIFGVWVVEIIFVCCETS